MNPLTQSNTTSMYLTRGDLNDVGRIKLIGVTTENRPQNIYMA